MTPAQSRQARDVLKWTRGELAEAAGVTPWIVAAFEDGRTVLPAYAAAIRSALEEVGIGFPVASVRADARAAGVTYSPRDRREGR